MSGEDFPLSFFIPREDREFVKEKAKDMFAELDDSGDGEVSQVNLRTQYSAVSFFSYRKSLFRAA